MNKTLINIMAALIPNKKKRKAFRKKYKEKKNYQIEWDTLFRQYMYGNSYIYDLYKEKVLKSNVLTDENSWFWLSWICILLQKNKNKEARKVLTDYVSGINGLKDIDRFLPVADLAEQMGYSNGRVRKAALVFRALEKNKNKFQKLICGKTIAVVGNGPSEMGKGKGPEIDAHDIVIRMNNYRTEGFESDYGSKTNVWIRGFGGSDLLDYSAKNKYLFAGITGNYHIIPLFYEFQLDILYRDLIERKIETGYISCDLYSKLTRLLAIEPTTGCVVLYAIKNLECQKMDFYGFSFQQKKIDGYATHYFNDRDENEAKERSKPHSWDKETEWLKKFLGV